MSAPAIVFTDLDGTLLDHESYSWKPAAPALAMLRDKAIPLVLASSKTAAEIAPLREEIGFSDCPAIVENGAGVLGACEDGSGDDIAHRQLLAELESLPNLIRSHFSGFSQWSVDELSTRTGLPPASAVNAAKRCFSEPGIWSGGEEARAEFERLLAVQGITARQGGRYLTLSFGATKAERMREIAGRYGAPRIVALGDAPNDIEMLDAADIGVIVANPDGNPLAPQAGETDGRIIRTEKPGPDGWNEAVLRIFRDMDFSG